MHTASNDEADGGSEVAAAGQLAALHELHNQFERHAIAYWLFGGWAVDFYIGRLSRPHADLDVAVWQDDGATIAELLAQEKWRHTPETGEDGYTCYQRDGVYLDVAFLARDDSGHIFTPLRSGRGEWPQDAFGDDLAELMNVRARVISLKALMADKSISRDEPATAAKDHADLLTLRNHS